MPAFGSTSAVARIRLNPCSITVAEAAQLWLTSCENHNLERSTLTQISAAYRAAHRALSWAGEAFAIERPAGS